MHVSKLLGATMIAGALGAGDAEIDDTGKGPVPRRGLGLGRTLATGDQRGLELPSAGARKELRVVTPRART